MTTPTKPRATTAAAAAARRLEAVDVVRGVFMILIICGHARTNLPAHHDPVRIVITLMLSGTVGFMTISGTLVGWFAVVKLANYDRVRRRYAKQAMRLLLFAHAVISLALFLPDHRGYVEFATRTIFITDVLSVLFLVAVPQIPRLAPKHRLSLGIALVILAPLAAMVPTVGPVTEVIKELLAGVDPNAPHILLSDYPLLSMSGMFFIGTWLGDGYAHAVVDGHVDEFRGKLARRAVVATTISAALVLVWALLRDGVVGNHPLVRRFLYPSYETTLYPLYLGWTLLLLAHTSGAKLTSVVARSVRVIGKTSLFIYLVQYFVVQTAPELLGWHGQLSPWEMAAFITGALGLLVIAAMAWNRWVKQV